MEFNIVIHTVVACGLTCPMNLEWASFQLPTLPFPFSSPRLDYESSWLSADPLSTHLLVLAHGKDPEIFNTKERQ